MNWVDKLQTRWELPTKKDVWVVLLIFSITGSSTVIFRKPIFNYLGMTDWVWYKKIIPYILFIFPTYQIMFLFWGFVLRQWDFCWKFEKKILSRFGIKFKD